MKRILLLILLSVVLMCGCSNKDYGKIKIPFGSEDYKSADYQYALSSLESAGFTNINCEPMGDLITGWLYKENEINEILVNGTSTFSKNSKFLPDVQIVISYHSFPKEENKTEAEETKKSVEAEHIDETADIDAGRKVYDSAIGKNAIDVKNELTKLGYKVEFKHDVTKMDFTESVLPSDSEYYIPFIIVKLGEYDADAKKTLFYINTQENIDSVKEKEIDRDNLINKLDSAYAWQAVENYGKQQYTYGFKLHYLTGRLNEESANENTWFLKAYCDVKNAYGKWEKQLVCEAYVTGTRNNPQITSFKVY